MKRYITILGIALTLCFLSACSDKKFEIEALASEYETNIDEKNNEIRNLKEELRVVKDELEQEKKKLEEAILLQKTDKVFMNLSELNWTELSKEVHPEKGLTFSFYADIGSQNNHNEVTFSKSKVKEFNTDEEVYTWGYDFSEKAFNFTANEYVMNFLLKYNSVNPIELDYTEITFNETSFESGGMLNTIHTYFPEAVYVEYHSPPGENTEDSPFAEYKWQSLRFVYEKVENEWYLFAIVRDIHSP